MFLYRRRPERARFFRRRDAFRKKKRVKIVGVRGGDRADAAAAAERRVAPARARGGASFCPPGTTREWDRECFFASAPPGGAGAVARARRRARPSETRRIRARCAAELVRATRVRALAADAASASAETHLASTLAAHAEFTMRMRERTRRQADLLASFEDDLETLRSTTLETKVLQTTRTTTESAHESQSRTCCSLLDLVDVTSLHEWHNSSRDAHDGFVARMESLETRVADLKRSVERVLATTPDVDVEALEAELDSARDALRAQKDVVDETLADAANARALASRCVAALEKRNLLEYDANEPEPPPLVDATQSGGEKRNELGETNEPRGRFSSVHVVPGELVTAAEVDALSAAEATHVSASFTRVAATDDVLAAFHAHCETCGSAMARDARARLIEIAETQRAIGAARDARAALEEIAIRTEKPSFVSSARAERFPRATRRAWRSRRGARRTPSGSPRARRVADLFAADEKEGGTGARRSGAGQALRLRTPTSVCAFSRRRSTRWRARRWARRRRRRRWRSPRGASRESGTHSQTTRRGRLESTKNSPRCSPSRSLDL